MTTFKDGPAQGQRLMLRRAPIFLRVTSFTVWDALDQPEDTPEPSENLFAYVLAGEPGHCHISTRGKDGRRGGGFYPIAEYRYVEQQPDDATMRDNAAWRKWCESHIAFIPFKHDLKP